MKPTQSRRPLAIQTALGPDAFLLTRFSVRERLSAPFEIEADLAATDAQADFNRVVGHKTCIRLERGANGPRYFNGYISRLVQTGNRGGFARYHATIVPWLWFLTRTADCRVFQRESAVDIAEKVFGGHRFGADFYDLRTTGTIPKRRYCVQYRETDFNFINRLLESEGIYYWFDHTDKGHKLVLANAIGASKPAKGCEKLEYHEVEQGGIAGREVVTEWAVEKEVQPVQYQLKDFDFKKPSDPLKAKHEVTREHGMARFALYDYPGEYFEPEDASRYAQLRMEEVQARHELVRGVTSAMGLAAGGVFELQKHPLTSENRKYLITDLQLTADAGEFASGGGGDPFFSCHFTAVPSTVPFRPARVTPKPIIQGVQTATVVGKKGREVDPDEYGRVKVQFHWDRYGEMNENSSCWVRVAQPMAGKGFGGMNIPRIGHEVVVEFIEGDPDRPLINGSIYNNEQMPIGSQGGLPELQRVQQKRQEAASQTKQVIAPQSRAGIGSSGGSPASTGVAVLAALVSALAAALTASKLAKLGKGFVTTAANPSQGVPAAAMMTSLKSNSIGGSGGSNEITLNDASGSETLFVKAERDMIVSVNNDCTTTVEGDVVNDISGDRHTMIDGKDTLNVDGESQTTVGKRHSLTIAKCAVIKIKGTEQHTVGRDQELTVGRDAITTIRRDATTKITGNEIHEVAKDSTFRVGQNHIVEIVKDRTTTIQKEGNDTLTLVKGNRTTTLKEGNDTVTLEKGNRTIDIKGEDKLTVAEKLTIEGKKIIEIAGTDEIVLKCGSDASITLKKNGDIEIKGTNIKLNATKSLEGNGNTVSSTATGDHTIKGGMVKIN